MRKKTTKTKREFTAPETPAPYSARVKLLDSFDGFGIGEYAWYRISASEPSYSCGLIKEIHSLTGGVSFFVWDFSRGMWRCLRREDIHRQKPPRRKRGAA